MPYRQCLSQMKYDFPPLLLAPPLPVALWPPDFLLPAFTAKAATVLSTITTAAAQWCLNSSSALTERSLRLALISSVSRTLISLGRPQRKEAWKKALVTSSSGQTFIMAARSSGISRIFSAICTAVSWLESHSLSLRCW